MISPIFWDFWPLRPHCSNVTFWQIPLPLSWWGHLWMTPTPILMITFLSLFEGIINSEVKYDNLNMHCHSGILLSINVTHHLTYQDFTTRTKHQNNHVHNSISKFFRQCTYLLTFYPNYDYTTRGFYFFKCRLNYSIKYI